MLQEKIVYKKYFDFIDVFYFEIGDPNNRKILLNYKYLLNFII